LPRRATGNLPLYIEMRKELRCRYKLKETDQLPLHLSTKDRSREFLMINVSTLRWSVPPYAECWNHAKTSIGRDRILFGVALLEPPSVLRPVPH
jgi:hypothetical protein